MAVTLALADLISDADDPNAHGHEGLNEPRRYGWWARRRRPDGRRASRTTMRQMAIAGDSQLGSRCHDGADAMAFRQPKQWGAWTMDLANAKCWGTSTDRILNRKTDIGSCQGQSQHAWMDRGNFGNGCFGWHCGGNERWCRYPLRIQASYPSHLDRIGGVVKAGFT